jgi:hypothetical protein
MIRKYSALLACALITSGVLIAPTVHVTAQERAAIGPDLSGRWQLNRELSEDAQDKLKSMRGGGRHIGCAGGQRGGGAGMHAQLEEVILNPPTSFILTQDDQKVVLAQPDGHVRTLLTDNRKVKVDGRDVQTKWENNRLVSEIMVGKAKIIETYERSPSAPQLIVTTKMKMRIRQVSVRRVYDAVTK